MITFIICWFIIVFLHAFILQSHKEKVENHIYETKVDMIAYQFWQGSLAKNGYPTNPTGSAMTMWEIYNYWQEGCVDKTPWVNHVKKYWK
jgi:hypothetical protein